MSTVYSLFKDIKTDLKIEDIEFFSIALLLFLFIFLFNNVSKQIETKNSINQQEIKDQLYALSTLKILLDKEDKEDKKQFSEAIYTSIDKIHPNIVRRLLYLLSQKENLKYKGEFEKIINTEIDRLLKYIGGDHLPDSIGESIYQMRNVVMNIIKPFIIASCLLIGILYFTYLMILLISLDLSFMNLISILLQICYMIMFSIIGFHWVKRRVESKNTNWDKGFKLFLLGIGIFVAIYFVGFTYPKSIVILIVIYLLTLFNLNKTKTDVHTSLVS